MRNRYVSVKYVVDHGRLNNSHYQEVLAQQAETDREDMKTCAICKATNNTMRVMHIGHGRDMICITK